MLTATTVNKIIPIVVVMPPQLLDIDTSVKEDERVRESRADFPFNHLLFQTEKSELAKNLFLWSQKLRSLESATHEKEPLTRILEQVYDSSSPSEVINKIAQLKNLIADWDKDFTAPSLETITNALEIAALFPKKFPVAKISISSDGEISLKLIRGKKQAVIDIDEDEEYGYTYFQGGRFVPGKEKAEVSDPKLPKDLLSYFAA